MSGNRSAGGPLEGIRVLDLSRVVAAPFTTMALGELGATVVKVERAGAGDDTRHWGPPFVAGESAYYLSVNRNKADVALDLGRPEAQQVVRDLAVGWADVVVENFKEGALDRWGLGLEGLRRANPRLVTATVRGYPEGDARPGYDFIIQAASGLMSLNGPPGSPFQKVGAPVADLGSGLFLLSGVLAALYERERSGCGQHVSVSLWESQVSLLVNANQSFLATGEPPRRLGNAHPQLAPYEVYQAADGPVAIGAGNDGQFSALARTLGREEWASDPRFAGNVDRVLHREELAGEIDAALAGRRREEVLAELTTAGVPCGPLRTVAEALGSQEAAMAGTVSRLPHPRAGEVPVVRLPWRFSATPAGPRSAPPVLGQDTVEVLESAGLAPGTIAELIESGAASVPTGSPSPAER